MTDASPSVAIYQLHASLLEISPAIWRRLHIRSDTTIANLHYMLQIAFGWTDSHLHRFVIYGKVYGITQPGGICFADEPRQVRLSDLRLHMNARFGYEYDFGDLWHHQLRLERILPFDNTRTYPYCSGGARDHFKPGANRATSPAHFFLPGCNRMPYLAADLIERGMDDGAELQAVAPTL